MSGWISSKLKAAENLLQQIDQQAAGTLKKGESQKPDELLSSLDSPSRSGDIVPLKDQLKKKSHNTRKSKDDDLQKLKGRRKEKDFKAVRSDEFGTSGDSRVTLTDNDWTELLYGPKQGTASASLSRGNVVSVGRSVQRNVKKAGAGSLGLKSGNVVEKNLKGDAVSVKSEVGKVQLQHRADVGKLEEKVGLTVDPGTDLAQRMSYPQSIHADLNVLPDGELASVKSAPDVDSRKRESLDSHVDKSNETSDLSTVESKIISPEADLLPVDDASSIKIGAVTSASLTSDDLKRSSGSFSEEERSDSDTDSSSSSDSESEREREERRRRKQKILAEKAAAKAAEALQERENLVARLEGEKQSLEKILEERARQQAQEASELQTTMMETMEAADLEKEKHNKTRMEALTRVSKLEIANSDLGKSLVTAQWNLEQEANLVAEISRQIHLKELAHEELRKRLTCTYQIGKPANQLAAARGADLERELLEAEYAFISDKIDRLQEKAKKLETDIDVIKSEIENPSEVELELKRRLHQMTDHLIQKQAQVEALSSEKATYQFRIESVSRSLEEHKSIITSMTSDSKRDIESGTWNYSKSKDKPSLDEKLRKGQQQFGSLLKQLDAIFSAGSAFLRRNPTARWWSLGYLICLHIWFMYIITSKSPQSSDDVKSGAVFSLENINNTAGI